MGIPKAAADASKDDIEKFVTSLKQAG